MSREMSADINAEASSTLCRSPAGIQIRILLRRLDQLPRRLRVLLSTGLCPWHLSRIVRARTWRRHTDPMRCLRLVGRTVLRLSEC